MAESRNSTIQCCNPFASFWPPVKGCSAHWNGRGMELCITATATSKDPSSLLDGEPIQQH